MPSPRVLVTALLAAALAAGAPAHAGDPVLDGKSKKALSFTVPVSDAQQHFLAETVDNPVDAEPANCVKPRCVAIPFTVKHARGLSDKTALSAHISWTLPTTRLWLQLVDVTGKSPVVKESCFSFYVTAGTSATVRARAVKPGHKYALWIYQQQVVAPDTVTGTVTFPATHTVAENPAPSPGELFVNGCNR